MIASRTFEVGDQSAFAELSGDSNPLHVDAVAARRTSFGRPVVHGIHLVSWALDVACAEIVGACTLASLRAIFKQPVRLGEMVRCDLTLTEDGALSAVLDVGERVVLRLSATLTPGAGAAVSPADERPAIPCRDLTFDEAARSAGDLPLALDSVTATRLFPSLSSRVGRIQLAELFALTRLVGMDCPGLHSTFAEVDIHAASETSAAPTLAYSVEHAEPRFSVLRLAVKGPTLRGMLKATYRPPPQIQARASELARLVSPGELAAQRVLVVGGSRGLGEVAAKLAGVAGADVVLTYHRGSDDAARVAEDVRAAGGRCRAIAFDVTAPPADLALSLGEGWTPTHLHYFATPFIAVDNPREFSAEKFATFCSYYVDGLYRTLRAIRALGTAPLAVLYPSTVFLDEPLAGAAEYCAAKAAGETLCHHLALLFEGTRFETPRLPRMRTDQTLSLLHVAAELPDAIILEAIRRLGA